MLSQVLDDLSKFLDVLLKPSKEVVLLSQSDEVECQHIVRVIN